MGLYWMQAEPLATTPCADAVSREASRQTDGDGVAKDARRAVHGGRGVRQLRILQ
jgi:hypothetical protein